MNVNPSSYRRVFLISLVVTVSFLFLLHSFPPHASFITNRIQISFNGKNASVPKSDSTSTTITSSNLEIIKDQLALPVNGEPSASFRDNLRNDTQYITSWIAAGWTNDVMTYGHLIYLALKLKRVPILASFVPTHIGEDNSPIFFGDVFDLPRLSKSIGVPVLEWRYVKDPASKELDELGCWAAWPAANLSDGKPRHSYIPKLLNLDISYTDAPKWIRLSPELRSDLHVSFTALASLDYPVTRKTSLVPARPSPKNKVLLSPDEHLLCYDFLYFAVDLRPAEYDWDYYPAWHQVLQYMRWVPKLENIAEHFVRRAFGTPESESIPPWITIHMRRADFYKSYCTERTPAECYAPMSVIKRRVEEVRQELVERKGIEVKHVIMTSDERDEGWWKEVDDIGWYRLDHSRTAKVYGAWYPLLIDAVVQSNGLGFVGTDWSTMSTLARRRVETWNGGAVRTVRWSHPGDDDH